MGDRSLLLEQAHAVEERAKPGRVRHSLLSDGDVAGLQGGVAWNQTLACEGDALAPRWGYGLARRCGRAVLDGVVSHEDAQALKAMMDRALANEVHRNSEVSMALNPRLWVRSGPGEELDWGPEDRLLLDRVNEAVRAAVARWLAPEGLPPLRTVGGLIKRVRLPALEGPQQVNPGFNPFYAHSDQHTVPIFEYTALLYLGTEGTDYGGGEVVFHDHDADRTVPTVAGRLVAFSAGLETLHAAGPIHWGQRHSLGLWFAHTENPDLRLQSPHPFGSSSPGLLAATAAASMLLLLGLGREVARASARTGRAAGSAWLAWLHRLARGTSSKR